MRKQETDQKAVVLGAAVVIACLIGGFVLVATLNRKDSSESDQSQSTQETASEQATTSPSASQSTTTTTTTPATPSTTTNSAPPASVPLQPREEKELTFPPSVSQIKAFFPEGITTVRYWYENMDGNTGYEVAVAYAQNNQAHLAVLTGADTLYHVLWDVEIPGQSVTSLEVGDRNGDDVTEFAVVTSQGSGSGYANILQFTEAAPAVFLLRGGEHDGQNTKISFSNTTSTLSTSGVYRVDLGDSDGDGKDEIDILTGPAVGDTSGEFQVYQDMYEWDGERYTFTSQSLISPAVAAE